MRTWGRGGFAAGADPAPPSKDANRAAIFRSARPDINSVVTLLPPSKTRRPAFLFRRRKLEKELSKPLDTTLPRHDLVSTDAITESEAATVQRLTAGSIFLSSFSQTANGHTLLLLGTGSQ